MVQYKNLNRNSAVESYEISNNYINVKFYNSNKVYTYSYQSANRQHIENMKILAIKGQGLNSYINKYVRNLYVR